jgi:alpha-1,6-mannosyltransferase
MRICDLTHAYTETSGGIRTYIDAKRDYIDRETDWEHTLIIPWSEDRVERNGRLTTVYIKGPLIRGAEPYRLLLNVRKVEAALREASPHVIELTSLYTCPWMAFRYRWAAGRRGAPCAVSAYYFTDLPTAYVEPAATRLAGPRIGRLAKAASAQYVRSIFDRADLALTATEDHAGTLRRAGVTTQIRTVHLGVDTDLFHPRLRSEDVRAQFGAGPDELLLAYAGRLDSEKHISVLVDAIELLPDELGARLVMMGEGPHRGALQRRADDIASRVGEPRMFILPYVKGKQEVAALLASADIYVTAGPHETFALSVVEGQAAGLPVVGVRAGALVDRVPDGLGRLGPVGDARAMARNIADVAAHRGEMGPAGRAHVVEHLAWSSTFSTILSAYESIAPFAIEPPPSLQIAA